MTHEVRRPDGGGARLREMCDRPGMLAARATRTARSPDRSALSGEINPEQLWETTLDHEVHSLLLVKVTHADSAEETFSMCDLVEPRSDFIQANALSVASLDA